MRRETDRNATFEECDAKALRVASILRSHVKAIDEWDGKKELVSFLRHVPGHSIVGLHENGISIEVRSVAGCHGVLDVGDQVYCGLKLLGLTEFKTSIDDVDMVTDSGSE